MGGGDAAKPRKTTERTYYPQRETLGLIGLVAAANACICGRRLM
jgi:hypothetical protein